MKWLIPLWLAVSCSAQDLGSFSNLPFLNGPLLSASSFSAPMPTYWWISTNLVYSNSVAIWTDVVQGASWTNGSSSTRPTNSVFGVGFNTSQVLTNSVLSFPASNVTCMIIIKPNSFGGNNYVITAQSFGNYWGYGVGGNPAADFSYQSGPIFVAHAGVDQDLLFPLFTTGAGVTGVWYTNGIVAKASDLGNFGPNQLLDALANIKSASGGLDGYIREIAFWPINMTTNASWVAQWHNYATNTYKDISP
jgi:hypothetical protein